MGKTYYNYQDTFFKSLMPLSTSRYTPDQYGSPSWIYQSEKSKYGVTLTSMKSATNISLLLTLEYYDNIAGYIRIEYDDGGVLTDATVIETLGENIWKMTSFEYTGRLNDILSNGDFQIFASDAEGTTANQTLIIRRVGIRRNDIQSIATWQVIGLEPMGREAFAIQNGEIGLKSDPTEIISLQDPTDALQLYQGMMCAGVADGSSTPLYFKVSQAGDTYWRDSEGVHSNTNVTYFDNGSDKIYLEYNDDSGVQTKEIQKTNTSKWLTANINLGGTSPNIIINAYSDTTTLSDPITDYGPSDYVFYDGGYLPSHSDTTPLPPIGTVSQYYLANDSFYISTDLPQDTSVFNIGSGAFTFTCWLRTNDADGNYIINDYYQGTGYKLVAASNGDLKVEDIDGNQSWTTGVTGLKDNNWHFVTWGSDGAGTMHVWLDGAQHQTRGYTTLDAPLRTDSFRFFDSFYTGYVQDIYFEIGRLIWDTATFTPPTRLMKDEYRYVGDPAQYTGYYSTQDADIKFTTDGTALYIQRITLESESFAEGIWRA